MPHRNTVALTNWPIRPRSPDQRDSGFIFSYMWPACQVCHIFLLTFHFVATCGKVSYFCEVQVLHLQRIASNRRWVALLLAFFFVTAWSLKTMHGVFYHADHHDRPICTVARDHSATHIHDSRYAGDDCPFCALALSTPILSALTTFVLLPAAKIAAKISLLYQSPCARLVGRLHLLSRPASTLNFSSFLIHFFLTQCHQKLLPYSGGSGGDAFYFQANSTI